MIKPTMPVIEDKKTQEEVRKALLNLAEQLNRELQALEDRITTLEGGA